MTISKVEVATKAIIINKRSEVLILQRSSNDNYASWEFDLPWWRLNLWEDPINWIKRELLEETWINIDNFIPIKTWSFSKNTTQIIWITYISEYISNNYCIKLSDEHKSYKWLKENDLIKNKLPSWLEKELILAFNIYKKYYRS